MSQPKPDPTEKSLRFGCGFVFGVVVGSIFIMRQVHAMGGFEWACVAGIAIIFGFLALFGGDDFWHAIFKWM